MVVPATQLPAPLHAEAAVSWAVAPSHEAGAQTVPAAKSVQEPLPSQVPSVPQVDAVIARQLARGSAPPFGTG